MLHQEKPKYQISPESAKRIKEFRQTSSSKKQQDTKASKATLEKPAQPSQIISQFQERNWLKTRGKEKYIDFKDEEIEQLRKYFRSLDNDGSGNIGVEELEDPLIALGLAQNREEVENLIKLVDNSGDNQIDFKEFLQIMSTANKSDKNKTKQQQKTESEDELTKGEIYEFFKKMSNGQLDDIMDENIPFRLNVSNFRRRQIIEAITGTEKEKKEKAQKIMQAFKKQLLQTKKEDKDESPKTENAVKTRTGFPKLKRIIESDQKNLKKPKAIPISK